MDMHEAYENARKRTFVALDFIPTLEAARVLVKQLATVVKRFKVHGLVDRFGAYQTVAALLGAGADEVFIDWKLHDTEGTVGQERAAVAKEASADWISVHVSGGDKMMAAARQYGPPKLIGITLLTSIGGEECEQICRRLPAEQVQLLAEKAKRAGLDAIVCSAQEVERLSAMPNLAEMDFIVPGTRSIGAELGGQVRVDTPENAMFHGADFLVAGRQVTQAADPIEALEQFLREMARGIVARGA